MLIDVERGRGREREGENQLCEKHLLVASCRYPDLDQTHSPGMWPGWELNL